MSEVRDGVVVLEGIVGEALKKSGEGLLRKGCQEK